ncbi:MAG: membrane dipeptidase [Aquaticitalea sp.]
MSIENNNYVDLHCHSTLKPFGKSFYYKKKGWNNPDRSRANSIWRYNPPTVGDKLLNYIINLTKFSQANFTSLAKGGVKVVCLSLYPLEKKFFVNKIGNEVIKDVTANFATGVGKERVDVIQGLTDYFEDLELEYDFILQLNNRIISLPEGKFKYRVVRNYSDIETVISTASNTTVNTICIVLSIEGMHVLNSNIDTPPVKKDFLDNLQKMKDWDAPPLFVSVAHHFWNHLCGHAESFTKLVKRYVDQLEGLGEGITPLGEEVIRKLLDTDNGKRILIDVKHMSVASRREFYQMLDLDENYRDIPIVVSHGAANGMVSFDDPSQNGSGVAAKLNPVDINFYNEELILIAKRKGIFGLQLDERRIASEVTLKATKKSANRSKIMHYRAELVWNQIQHFLEVLDNEGLFAWDCMALGTDFDGIIDPLNGFWTSEELPFLADFMERHAFNYMSKNKLKVPENNIEADEIIARVMSTNGMNFLKANFK